MNKRVRYNGLRESYYACSDPKKLVVGKEYEVLFEDDRGYQTDYTLRGVEGHFNSVWFYPSSSKTAYTAVSRHFPVVGARYSCSKLEYKNGQLYLVDVNTSTVREVSHVGSNVYHVETLNSVYIVQVM